MSKNLQELRRQQIREVLDADKKIAERVRDALYRGATSYDSTYRPSTKVDKKVAFELEKYIIEMENILVNMQSNLEQRIQSKDVEELEEAPVKEIIEENKGEIPAEVKIEGEGREQRFDLLEVYNKFINYVNNVANLGEFNQRDFNVLYDRLDDLIPLLRQVQQLNQRANALKVAEEDSAVVDAILQKIERKDLRPIRPTEDITQFNPAEKEKREKALLNLINVRDEYPTQVEVQTFDKERRRLVNLVNNRNRKGLQDEAKQYELELEQLVDRVTKYYETRLFREDLDKRIRQLEREIKSGRYVDKVVVPSSRRPPIGGGRKLKSVDNDLIREFGENFYALYNSIDDMSIPALEKFYIDLLEKRKYAQSDYNTEDVKKYNKLIDKVLTHPNSQVLSQIYGSGKSLINANKYGVHYSTVPYIDTDNMLYKSPQM